MPSSINWSFLPPTPTEKLRKAMQVLSVEKVEEAIKEGADVNWTDEEGNTLLHHHFDTIRTPWSPDWAIEKLLIAAGLDPSTKNKRGETYKDVQENINKFKELHNIHD